MRVPGISLEIRRDIAQSVLDGKITIGTHRQDPREKTGAAGARPFFPVPLSPDVSFRPPESRR
jgi:hypothetical protein